MNRIELLELIAARSRMASREAANAIRAVQNSAPTATRRCATAAAKALDDDQAIFSDEERKLLATLLGAPLLDDVRGLDIRLRVSKAEKRQVQEAAEAADLSLSNYIRRALGLSLVD
jgi:hypothetical protein